ncbi:MAG: rhamnogalacturonan acetylesterase [Sedimentisphaerales bacterium]|nr:rhamnogalacturonan acetylesterase [Sedimentisphaerales bacterium]
MTSFRVAVLGLLCTFVSTGALWAQDEPVQDKPTLFVVGDSTASNSRDLGWGSHLGKYFDADKVAVVNRARAGRSSRTFITEGLWDAVLADMKVSDFVLIQFGHNDGGLINDARRARGSLPGLGEETREIDNLQTGQHEVVHTYGWYMRKMIAETKAKGATPIVLSLTVRNEWPAGRVERGSGRFSQWAAQIAQTESVAFVDAMNIIADQYELLGRVRVAEFFPIDHTHTSAEGANLNAILIVSGLKANTQDVASLQGMLSAEGQAITPCSANCIVKQVEETMTAPWMPEALPESDPNLPTLFLIGDSTVRTGTRGDGANGQWGWGAPIMDYFDRTRINVENRALGGTSSRSYQTLGLWEKVLADMKPGDFVIMQFGHNDSGPLNDRQRARGTIKGNGDETEEIDNLLTGKHEIVHSYGWYLRKYITEAKAKGATPFVCSLIPRNRWQDGRVNRSSEDYALWAAQAAQAESVGFIPLNDIIADRYEQIGMDRVTALYFPPRETTHTNACGARFNADCVVEGLKALDGCPLVAYLKDRAR